MKKIKEKIGIGFSHWDALDGMRGLAVLMVFMSHTSGREMPLAPWLKFDGIGHVGVYLFFVLSGFLLTKNLLAGQTFKQFYLRRLFRIIPLYFCVLAGVLAYQSAGYYSPRYLHISGGGEGALLHFLFLKGDGVFWTLAAEFTFYLMLPMLVVAISRFGYNWLVAFAVLYFLWYYLVQQFGLNLAQPKFVEISHKGQYLDVFACGILAAYIRTELSAKWVALVFWGLLAVTLICVSSNFLGADRLWYGLRWLSLLYGVVFALGVASALQGNMWLTIPLQNRWLMMMGVAGFSWYLLHFPVLQAVNHFLDLAPILRFLVSALVCAALSWGTYQLIELPFIRVGRKLESWLS